MDIINAFMSNGLHTPILIKGTNVNPLFRASDIGDILEMANIRTSIQNFDETEKVVKTIETGGGTQQVTFLTEKGLYKVLFKSRKPIAEKLQNWMCDVIKEIRLNNIYTDKKIEETRSKVEEIEHKLNMNSSLEREKTLLEKFGASGSIIYILKVKTYEDGTYVIKIGESRRGIRERYNQHKTHYEECILLDCFNVQRSKDFERFIHQYPSIRPNKVRNLQGHESENELFLIGEHLTYSEVITVIRENIDNYNHRISELLLKIELLETQLSQVKNENYISNPSTNLSINEDFTQKITSLENVVHSLENVVKILANNQTNQIQQIPQSHQLNIVQPQAKLVTGFGFQNPHIGPRLQKINPDTMKLVQVYETVTDAMNENKNIKRPSIMKAIEENTVYCGFRWFLVERNKDANVMYDIPPTREILEKNSGYIAKLNNDKTQILAVYLDRKTAAFANGYQTSSGLDNPVKNGTIINNHYYMLYKNCNRNLIQRFEEEHGEPILYKDGIGKFNEHKELVQEFACKCDCFRSKDISEKTLAKALDQNIAYNGFFYKSIGKKLQIP